jgi:hypothetical protein
VICAGHPSRELELRSRCELEESVVLEYRIELDESATLDKTIELEDTYRLDELLVESFGLDVMIVSEDELELSGTSIKHPLSGKSIPRSRE